MRELKDNFGFYVVYKQHTSFGFGCTKALSIKLTVNVTFWLTCHEIL